MVQMSLQFDVTQVSPFVEDSPRDLTSYVGEDVTQETWEALRRRLPPGWSYVAEPIDGGWHITKLEATADET